MQTLTIKELKALPVHSIIALDLCGTITRYEIFQHRSGTFACTSCFDGEVEIFWYSDSQFSLVSKPGLYQRFKNLWKK